MSYRTINSAQKAIWPAVKHSMTLHRAQRQAVRGAPHLATAAATARARIPHDRVVANEAVWAIAKQDLLNSPEQAEVIAAAREWAKSLDKIGGRVEISANWDPEDLRLYDAVQALATDTSRTPEEIDPSA